MISATSYIDIDALQSNARTLMARAEPAQMMAVIKADAYGHGAVRVAKILKDVGVRSFAVATIEEAIELRTSGISDPILVLGSLVPGLAATCIQHDLDVTLGSDQAVEEVLRSDSPAGLRVHLKIDTGMGRLGIRPGNAAQAIAGIRASEASLSGVSTHLATADHDNLDLTFQQIETLTEIVRSNDIGEAAVHLANTEAIARVDSSFRPFDRAFVRAGIGLFGYPDRQSTQHLLGLKPANSLSARVTNVKKVQQGTPISYGGLWVAPRDTWIATVAAGYADGYPRNLSGKSWIGIGGRQFPVVGSICMDMTMVDAGPDGASIRVGDEARLYGEGGPNLYEISEWAGTIPYEIMCRLGRRVTKVYR